MSPSEPALPPVPSTPPVEEADLDAAEVPNATDGPGLFYFPTREFPKPRLVQSSEISRVPRLAGLAAGRLLQRLRLLLPQAYQLIVPLPSLEIDLLALACARAGDADGATRVTRFLEEEVDRDNNLRTPRFYEDAPTEQDLVDLRMRVETERISLGQAQREFGLQLLQAAVGVIDQLRGNLFQHDSQLRHWFEMGEALEAALSSEFYEPDPDASDVPMPADWGEMSVAWQARCERLRDCSRNPSGWLATCPGESAAPAAWWARVELAWANLGIDGSNFQPPTDDLFRGPGSAARADLSTVELRIDFVEDLARRIGAAAVDLPDPGYLDLVLDGRTLSRHVEGYENIKVELGGAQERVLLKLLIAKRETGAKPPDIASAWSQAGCGTTANLVGGAVSRVVSRLNREQDLSMLGIEIVMTDRSSALRVLRAIS